MGFWTLGGLGAGALIVLVGCGPGAAPGPAALTLCQVPGFEGPARCGSLSVPEDPSHPERRTLLLRTVVISGAAGHPPDPVFVLVGGPGQGAAAMAALLAERSRRRYPDRELVFVDQRGTGDSNPLQCPPPERVEDQFGHIFFHAGLAECRGALAARAELARYGTDEAADDLDAVREQLGYARVDIDAGSYGTRLALTWARRHPTRVRAMVLSGVAPDSLRIPLPYAASAQAALEAVFADCAAEPDCGARFPELEAEWQELVTRLSQAPVEAEVRTAGTTRRVRFGAGDLAYSARGMLYGAGAVALPALIHAAHTSGDLSGFAQSYLDRRLGFDTWLAWGLHLSVICAEDVPRIGPSQVETRGTFLGDYLVDEYRRACAIWDVPARQPPLQAGPITTPLLVFSGRRDPSTPASDAARVLEGARDALHVVYPRGGHGWPGGDDRGCRERLAAAFVAAGSAAGLDPGCAAEVALDPFVLELP